MTRTRKIIRCHKTEWEQFADEFAIELGSFTESFEFTGDIVQVSLNCSRTEAILIQALFNEWHDNRN